MKKGQEEARALLLPKAIASLLLLSYIEGLPTDRDRALFGICLYTTARVNEACSLHTAGVYGTDGRVRDRITFRRATTKGKQETRSVPVSPELRELLTGYRSDRPYLFPGRWGRGQGNGDRDTQLSILNSILGSLKNPLAEQTDDQTFVPYDRRAIAIPRGISAYNGSVVPYA